VRPPIVITALLGGVRPATVRFTEQTPRKIPTMMTINYRPIITT